MAIEIVIPYGTEKLSATLDCVSNVVTLDVAEAPMFEEASGALLKSLIKPLGMNDYALNSFHAGEKVGIVVSDSFRYTGISEILPALLDALAGRGILSEHVFFLVATGVHRPPTDEELCKILGSEIYTRYLPRCFSHAPDVESDLRYCGETTRGTPVWLNKRLFEADHIILTGTVVLHYFAGFGGGRKSLVPGLAGTKTIAKNHALNLDRQSDRLDPAVQIGRLNGNPVADDLEEAAAFVPVDFIVNTVLNSQRQIAGLFVGDRTVAHRTACEFASTLYEVPLESPADLVIASAGNARNFVQSHKALFNAWQAMKPGGRIVFLTPAQEGLGAKGFTEWLSLRTQSAVIARLRRNAEINGQTALSTLEKAPSAIMVTEMSGEDVGLMGARKAVSLQTAVETCLAELRESGIDRPSVCLMPSASYTVPSIGGD